MIGTFSSRQSTPISKPLYVGPSCPNQQFMTHQNRKIDPPTLRVCRPHKKYHGITKRTVYGCEICSISICKQCHIIWHKPNVN